MLAALGAIADGGWEAHGSDRYLNLPLNAAWIYDLVVRGAAIALPGREPVRADFAVNFDDTLAQTDGTVAEVGDLEAARALEEIDAAGLFFVPDAGSLSDESGTFLSIGDTVSGVLSRDPAGTDVVVRLQAGRPTTER